MTLPRFIFIALVLASSAIPSAIRSEEKAKPDRATLEAQFKKADADRAAAKENTKERADAAKNAMQLASDIAWLAFDATKFDEAATWFETSAKFKEESYLNARGYWEQYLRTTAIELDSKVDDQIKTQRAQLASADDGKKPMLQQLIHGWEKLRYLNRYNAVTMLEQITRDNNDGESLLKYCQQELEIRWSGDQKGGEPKPLQSVRTEHDVVRHHDDEESRQEDAHSDKWGHSDPATPPARGWRKRFQGRNQTSATQPSTGMTARTTTLT